MNEKIKIITKQEIIAKGYFLQDELYPHFDISLFLPFFGKEVKMSAHNILTVESEPEMNLVVTIVNELIDFKQENLIWLKSQIWDHYQSCVSNISYNEVSLDGFINEVEANKAHLIYILKTMHTKMFTWNKFGLM